MSQLLCKLYAAVKVTDKINMLFPDNFSTFNIQTSGAKIHGVHAGKGRPLLLLHGYPQTHAIWHQVAPLLAQHFHVICPDLRGYGDSEIPLSTPDHYPYSKRAMAQDMAEVMEQLGHDKFFVAGHDRGARVTHRLALDYPDKILKACVMDIAPTRYMFNSTDQNFATGYYHWFFLIQPDGLPERMIGADPTYYLMEKLKRWAAPGMIFNPKALEQYIRCFSRPESIHASCEDYRAAATIDLHHDSDDENDKMQAPLLVLWGKKGFVHRTYNVIDIWSTYASSVEGKVLECGHFLPEELPKDVANELLAFFRRV
jgi:haloacetate dehalogenase